MDIRRSAFAVIVDDRERVLLLHRRDLDCWDLPGGGAEQGEAVREAVVREVREECGLEVIDGRLTGLYHKPDATELAFVYRCTASGTPYPSPEADAARYFDARSPAASLSPNHAQRIRDALDDHRRPAIRIQPTYEWSRGDGSPGWTAISPPDACDSTRPASS